MRRVFAVAVVLWALSVASAEAQVRCVPIGDTNRICRGAGSPEGAVLGNPADLYLRTDGGSGATVYTKTSGAGTNTGWTALTTGATIAGVTNQVALFTGTSAIGGDTGLTFDPSANTLRVSGTSLQQYITTDTNVGSTNRTELWFGSDYDGTVNWAGIGQHNDGGLKLTGGGDLSTPHVTITDAGAISFISTGAFGGTVTAPNATVSANLTAGGVTRLGGGTLAGAAPAGATFSVRQNTATGDALSAAFVDQYTGTTAGSAQNLESYLIMNAPSGTVSLVLDTISHIEFIGAGASTTAKVYSGSAITNTGAGAVGTVCIFCSDGVIRLGTAITIGDAYHLYSGGFSATAGITRRWGVYMGGAGDANYFAGPSRFTAVEVDKFTVNLAQVFNGNQIFAKSSTRLFSAFTCPVLGAANTLIVRDIPDLLNTRVFASLDYVIVKTFVRTDGDSDGNLDFAVGECVGRVTAYADGSGADEGSQSWTFTRPGDPDGGGIAGSTVIAAESVVINYGAAGQGTLRATVTDGAEGVEGGYFDVLTWSGGSPAIGNQQVRTRIGNLLSETAVAEYGFLAGDFAGGNYVRMTDQNVDIKQGGGVVVLDENGISIATAATVYSLSRSYHFTSSSVVSNYGMFAFSDATTSTIATLLTGSNSTTTQAAMAVGQNQGGLAEVVAQTVDAGATTNARVDITVTAFNGGSSDIFLTADDTVIPGRVRIVQSGTYSSETLLGIRILDGTDDVALHMGADAANDIGFIQAMDPGTSFGTRPLTLQANGGSTWVGSSGTTDGNMFRLQDADGTCDYNPESGAVTVSCSSDARLKRNIKDAPSALDYLAGFKVRQYTVRASGGTGYGPVAQEVMLTRPERVWLQESKTLPGGVLSVEQPNPWRLVQAVQELRAEIAALRAIIDKLTRKDQP